MKWTLALALFATLSACGGGDDDDDGSTTADAATGTAADAMSSGPDAMATGPDAMPQAAFSLTSTAFADGAVIPTVHTCAGADTSPPFAWTNPPAGTQSLAIVFVDLSFNNFNHGVVWDIPTSVNALPANLSKVFEPSEVPGTKQSLSWRDEPGYAGPCPPADHTYEFKLHALDVATLPGVDATTTENQAKAAVEAASLGFTTLEGTFDPNNP
tara:strand:- start:11673 stop:12311 length:639 start_codon:yes stop_codon:yes gene_type:complete